MCGSVCLGLYKAHTHGDCCEAMHACVGVCVWACTRRILTVIAAKQCMHVLLCVHNNASSFSHVYVHTDTIMPTRTFTHMQIMPMRVCTKRSNLAYAYVHT